MFWLLMRLRVLSARNVFIGAWRRHPAATLAKALGGAGLFAGMFGFFILFFDFASKLQVLPETIYQAFYYLFLLLFAGAVPFVASTLLQSEDYNLLFAAPIPPRTVVAAKLLDATVTNSLQFSVLGFPAIVACAVAVHLPLYAWPLVPLLIALFVLLPAVMVAFALLLALAAIGMRRLRSAIILINVLMGVVICITFVLETRNLPMRLVSGGASWTTLAPAASAASTAAHLAPSHWFATLLLSLGWGGSVRNAVPSLALILILVGALFVLCMGLGGRLLSLSSLAESESNTTALPAAVNNARRWRLLFPSSTASLISKDLKFVWRDSMLVSQLCVPLILFAVPFLLTLQNRSLDPRTELYPFAVGIIGFIVYMQTSILSLSLLGMEAQSFWVVLISPNARRSVLYAKWAASSIVTTAIGSLLGLFSGIAFNASAAWILLQIALTSCSASALCALGVGISATFPRFLHENPAMRVSPWALIVGFFASTGYVLVAGLIAGIAFYFLSSAQSGSQTAIIFAVCGMLYLILTLITIAVPLTLGSQRIERYEWEH